MHSNADARCSECGSLEPHWCAAEAEPDAYRVENERLRAALKRIADQDYDTLAGDFTKWPSQIAADALKPPAPLKGWE